MFGFRLFVIIVFIATSEPIKYAPLSPRKILDCGKLNKKMIKELLFVMLKKLKIVNFHYLYLSKLKQYLL